MFDNKLVKTIVNAGTLTGLAAGIGWMAKKLAKENFTSDPGSNVVLCSRSSLRENKPAFTSHFNAFFTVPTAQLEDKVLNGKNPF